MPERELTLQWGRPKPYSQNLHRGVVGTGMETSAFSGDEAMERAGQEGCMVEVTLLPSLSRQVYGAQECRQDGGSSKTKCRGARRGMKGWWRAGCQVWLAGWAHSVLRWEAGPEGKGRVQILEDLTSNAKEFGKQWAAFDS